jgi:hypothetical protein
MALSLVNVSYKAMHVLSIVEPERPKIFCAKPPGKRLLWSDNMIPQATLKKTRS